jgi:hypothetical protein
MASGDYIDPKACQISRNRVSPDTGIVDEVNLFTEVIDTTIEHVQQLVVEEQHGTSKSS